jgi:hypothetical protein
MKYGRRPQYFKNGRQPQFFLKEDDLNFLKIEGDPKPNNATKTIKSINNNIFE